MKTVLVDAFSIAGILIAALFSGWFLKTRHSTHPAYVVSACAAVAINAALSLACAAYVILDYGQPPLWLDTAHAISNGFFVIATCFLFHHFGRMLGRTESRFL